MDETEMSYEDFDRQVEGYLTALEWVVDEQGEDSVIALAAFGQALLEAYEGLHTTFLECEVDPELSDNLIDNLATLHRILSMTRDDDQEGAVSWCLH